VLCELMVRDLGVIESLSLVLGPGMTALTGETGAGKTVLVGAIDLLLGGRSDATMVRAGADEARVDGRFVTPEGTEHVLTRIVPRSGRTRAYHNGNPVPLQTLAGLGTELVDLHGQHAHQSLLGARAQRDALDAFGGIDRSDQRAARAAARAVDEELAALGGDSRARLREMDLLRFQLDEISAARLDDPGEEQALGREEDVLADAVSHREAGAAAVDALTGDGGVLDALGRAVAVLGQRGPFAAEVLRLRTAAEELADCARELRSGAERIDPDPERLAEVRARRMQLRELRRKYGEDLAAVMTYAAQAGDRLAELERHDERVTRLEAERERVRRWHRTASTALKAARQAAAPRLAAAVGERLAALAMPRARIEVAVGSGHAEAEAEAEAEADDGGAVQILIAANPGAPPAPLQKAASGGELARTMLALRLALLETGESRSGRGPWTLVFDEVDAGIGGATAIAVGRALSALGVDRQVLVVTHLAQVAAAADTQVLVAKHDDGETTTTTVRVLDHEDRLRELSRMLAGRPDSTAALAHAEELLAAARSERSSGSGASPGRAPRAGARRDRAASTERVRQGRNPRDRV
jgi:DNA repair protein RecN (Recombination protein N)